MKVVALALVLLLAVASRAAPQQAEVPTQLQQARSVVAVYVNQVKDSANKALDHLDDTEYKEYKAQLKQALDNMHLQLQNMQAVAAPYTDAFATQIMESTAAVRESIMTDIETLKAELGPKREHLKDVINKHIEDYRVRMEPIIQEYSAMHKTEMEVLKAKLEPIMAELHAKVAANVEETKAALMPIVDTVRNKVNERLLNLKDIVSPYVDEYKDQLKEVYQQARERATSLSADDIQTQVTHLKEQAVPMAEDFKAKIMALYETLAAALNKN